MEFIQRPQGFMEFLQNNNHQAVTKMNFEHSPYYIALGSPQNPQ